jgi:hypothetical protein
MTMANIPTFEEYLSSLIRLTPHVSPLDLTAETEDLKLAASSLSSLESVTLASLSAWVSANPAWVRALGLVVGLSQEKLKNILTHRFQTAGWITLARTRPTELVTMLDDEFDLIRLVEDQRNRKYDFGDILVSRAGTRATATRAGASGRGVEDEIENIAISLGLTYETRTRFSGRSRTAPCDLVIPNSANAAIVVAAKGYDSTGSKLTDAVREIEEMAAVRLPSQYVIAVIDGIGWKSRRADLQRIYQLRADHHIDGMYSLASLDQFRDHLVEAARLRGLLPGV